MSALEQLVAMGFEEERSKKALETYGFDVERAVNFLVVTNDETVGSEQQQVYKAHTLCSEDNNSFTFDGITATLTPRLSAYTRGWHRA